MLFRIFGQTILTLWTGSELRGLLVDTNAQDPTGGIVFIVSVFRQHTLWKNVDHAALLINEWIKSILGKHTAQTLPDSQTPNKLYNSKATGAQNQIANYE